MNPEKLSSLIGKITDATKRNNLRWEKTPTENAYQTTIAHYIIKSFQEADSEDPEEPNYVLHICDENGELIERIIYSELSQEEREKIDMNLHIALKQIHILARRSAMGADKAVENIISALDELPPF